MSFSSCAPTWIFVGFRSAKARPCAERKATIMSTMIQAIVYDAVGTLIHVQPAVSALYADVGQRFGSKLDAVAMT